MKETIQEERMHYSREFKRSVIKEYLDGELTKAQLMRKHGIRVNGGILRWMRQLGYIDSGEKDGYLPSLKPLSLPPKKEKKAEIVSNDSQQQRINELERLLEDEQLRSEAYRRIIDIAEKEYNVPIRKKPNTR